MAFVVAVSTLFLKKAYHIAKCFTDIQDEHLLINTNSASLQLQASAVTIR
jgi:hypothetical protein